MTEEMNKVTSLVQDLLKHISTNRETHQDIQSMSDTILANEQARLQKMQELGLEEENYEEPHVDPAVTENLRLKMQLQKLREFGDQSEQLVRRYDAVMNKLSRGSKEWVRDYAVACKNLNESYEQRVREERWSCYEYEQGQERLKQGLRDLRVSMIVAKDQLPNGPWEHSSTEARSIAASSSASLSTAVSREETKELPVAE